MGLIRDFCIEAMSWDTGSEGLHYLLIAGSAYPLSHESHERTGGKQVHVHTTVSALEKSEAN